MYYLFIRTSRSKWWLPWKPGCSGETICAVVRLEKTWGPPHFREYYIPSTCILSVLARPCNHMNQQWPEHCLRCLTPPSGTSWVNPWLTIMKEIWQCLHWYEDLKRDYKSYHKNQAKAWGPWPTGRARQVFKCQNKGISLFPGKRLSSLKKWEKGSLVNGTQGV